MKLYNENCFHTLRSLKDSSIDSIVTDPPYGIDYKEWDKIKNFEEYTLEFLKECYRVLKPGKSMWLFFAPTQIKEVLSAVDKSEFTNNLQNWSIFARNKGRGAKTKLKSLREDIFHLSKGEYKTWNYVEYLRDVVAPYYVNGKPRGFWLDQETGKPIRYTGQGNILTFTPPTFNNKFEPQWHPAQKPVILMLRLIMLITRPGDTVLDPFMGSGSTGVAAEISGREFIGVEMDKEIFKKAKKWLENINYKEVETMLKRTRVTYK